MNTQGHRSCRPMSDLDRASMVGKERLLINMAPFNSLRR